MRTTLDELLQRSNEMGHFIENEVAGLPQDVLTRKPSEKTWSAIEVVDHLNKVYNTYLDNFDKAISSANDLPDGAESKHKSSFIGWMGAYTMKPKGQKRKFKMKTFDFFQPTVEDASHDQTIQTFLSNKTRFNELIKNARSKDITKIKMPTAMGDRYKMYVGECFAFVLAHEERHMVQIQELMAVQPDL